MPTIAAHPRWLGVLLVVTVVMIGRGRSRLLSTEVGQARRPRPADCRRWSRSGQPSPTSCTEQMERMAPPWRATSRPAVSSSSCPLGLRGRRRHRARDLQRGLGGDATFKQVFAVVAHSQVVVALQQLFVDCRSTTRASRCRARPTWRCSCRSSTRRHVRGAAARLRSICSSIWWIVSLAIGSACCTSDRTAPIAMDAARRVRRRSR